MNKDSRACAKSKHRLGKFIIGSTIIMTSSRVKSQDPRNSLLADNVTGLHLPAYNINKNSNTDVLTYSNGEIVIFIKTWLVKYLYT